MAQLLQDRTTVRIRVCGPSMRPTLRDGDCVAIRPAVAEGVKRGQIALFRQHGRWSLHRRVGANPDGRLRFAADAGLRGVELVRPEDILGLAETRERGASVRRLDGWPARAAGLALFWARPLRRWALAARNALRRGPPRPIGGADKSPAAAR